MVLGDHCFNPYECGKTHFTRLGSQGYSFSYSLYNRMSEEGKNEADNLFDGIPTDKSLASKFMKIISEKCSKNDQRCIQEVSL